MRISIVIDGRIKRILTNILIGRENREDLTRENKIASNRVERTRLNDQTGPCPRSFVLTLCVLPLRHDRQIREPYNIQQKRLHDIALKINDFVRSLLEFYFCHENVKHRKSSMLVIFPKKRKKK